MASWVGDKPGTFVNDSTLVPIDADNLNATVRTLDKVIVGGELGGVDAATITGKTLSQLLNVSDELLSTYYSFDSISGTIENEVLCDDSGTSNHGVVHGTPTLTSGISGKAMIFDGVNDWVSGKYTNSSVLTVSCWYKGNPTTGTYKLVSLKRSSTDNKFSIQIINGSAVLKWRNSSASIITLTGPAINDNVFHFVSASHNGTNGYLYVDGVLQQQYTDSLISDYYNEIRIAASEEETPLTFAPGTIDDVRVYNKALSANEHYGLFFNKSGVKSCVTSQENLPNSIAGRGSSGELKVTHISLDNASNSILNIKNTNTTEQTVDLNIDIGSTNKSITLAGNLSLPVSNVSLSSDASGSAITLPATGTLSTLAGTETLTNKTLTSPKINEDVQMTATATELNYVKNVTSNIQTQLNAKAPINSPALTGEPTAPTPIDSDNSTKIATTAFVKSQSSLLTADQLAALAGTSGTPSATNKFVTDQDSRITSGSAVTVETKKQASHAYYAVNRHDPILGYWPVIDQTSALYKAPGYTITRLKSSNDVLFAFTTNQTYYYIDNTQYTITGIQSVDADYFNSTLYYIDPSDAFIYDGTSTLVFNQKPFHGLFVLNGQLYALGRESGDTNTSIYLLDTTLSTVTLKLTLTYGIAASNITLYQEKYIVIQNGTDVSLVDLSLATPTSVEIGTTTEYGNVGNAGVFGDIFIQKTSTNGELHIRMSLYDTGKIYTLSTESFAIMTYMNGKIYFSKTGTNIQSIGIYFGPTHILGSTVVVLPSSLDIGARCILYTNESTTTVYAPSGETIDGVSGFYLYNGFYEIEKISTTAWRNTTKQIPHIVGSTDSTARPILWAVADQQINSVGSSTNVTIQSNIGRINATSFNATSLREAKTDIKHFEKNATNILVDTEICSFYYKEDKKKEFLKIGFIANDTNELLATKNHDTMDITSCIGILIKSIQELNKKIDDQQVIINKLQKPFWKRLFK
jgi:hypothetical protein